MRFDRSAHEAVGSEHSQRQKRTAVRLIRGLFSPSSVPGMILGDEVGMGKTYETLGVVAALLKHVPGSRVVILAHSRDMAKTWCSRWELFRTRAVASRFAGLMPEGTQMSGPEDMGKPGVLFGSYETYKRASSMAQASMLEYLLDGCGLHDRTRRRLRFALFRRHRAEDELDESLAPPALGFCRRLFRQLYDRSSRTWRSEYDTVNELRRLVLRATRRKRTIDLLIIDEAHKMEGGQREVFLSEVLRGRARRVLFVTATPFALRVGELLGRIKDMFEATGDDESKVRRLESLLERFGDVVRNRSDLHGDLRRDVERELGEYLVRSSWPENFSQAGRRAVARRKHATLRHEGQERMTERDALAVLALELAFLRIAENQERVHRAAHRETLCSSYSAIRDKLRKRGDDTPLPRYLQGLAQLIPKTAESPKFTTALRFLRDRALNHHKVVVFCKRLSTVSRMRRDLHRLLRQPRDAAAADWVKAQKRLARLFAGAQPNSITADALALLRLATYSGQDVKRSNWRSVVKRLRRDCRRAAESEDEFRALLDQTWGRGRHADWVAELSGRTTEAGGKGRSQEAVRFGFNLPGPPYILLCTRVAREGIDLHHWCHRVLQYDLEWNPAWMEQQIGRVDRINSYSWRKKVPVEVYYAHQPGTYEERIANVIRQRCEMLRVLLGAGQWLAGTPEEQARVAELKRYQLDFRP